MAEISDIVETLITEYREGLIDSIISPDPIANVLLITAYPDGTVARRWDASEHISIDEGVGNSPHPRTFTFNVEPGWPDLSDFPLELEADASGDYALVQDKSSGFSVVVNHDVITGRLVDFPCEEDKEILLRVSPTRELASDLIHEQAELLRGQFTESVTEWARNNLV